ncbi:hypothetical protein TWF694_005821 [Orbilia ellipsospora]|uniref:Uncharacterized protein n=1 Tax=Orbilia ellipsospora TaxID=2528407 RepID=A0AAV9WTN2_9PEZI
MPLPLPVLTFLLLSTTTPITALFSSSKNKPKPPPPSLFSRLLPLIILFTIVTVIAIILYLTYITVVSLSSDVHSRLDSKNIKLSRTGADVEVKGINYEKYHDLTQKVVVSAWNTSETKGYKSRLFSSKDKSKSNGKQQKGTLQAI